MGRTGERFCEEVGAIGMSRNVVDGDGFGIDGVADKMVTDVDVLGTRVELTVVRVSDGGLIVGENRSGGVAEDTEFGEKAA